MQIKFFHRISGTFVAFIFLLWFSLIPALAWRQLGEGLLLGDFHLSDNLGVTDSKVVVLKIDPKRYALKLLSASEQHTESMTAGEWAEKFGLVAVTNASMYQVNRITSTGYMRNYAHQNNPKINSKFGAFLAFNPVDDSVPPVQIIDKYYQRWEKLTRKYNTVVQNYRMISIKQENLWSQTSERYSVACVGIDNDGNILFIHSGGPFSVHDFNEILLRLPINIYNAMFVEGGSEAFLYVNTGRFVGRWLGSDNNWARYDPTHDLLPVPNVIGIIKR